MKMTTNENKNLALGYNSKVSINSTLNYMICSDHEHAEEIGFEDCCLEMYGHLDFDIAKELVKNRIFSIFMGFPENLLEKHAERILKSS